MKQHKIVPVGGWTYPGPRSEAPLDLTIKRSCGFMFSFQMPEAQKLMVPWEQGCWGWDEGITALS